MSSEREAMTASFKMVQNLRGYTEVISKQISEVQVQLETASSSVMTSLLELSASTGEKKAEAERVLEQTYFAPDAGTTAMVDSVQKSTDDIFEMAQQQMATGKAVNELSQQTGDRDAEIRRTSGLFSKHMESLSTLDDSLKDVILNMVGSMSTNDVIKQKLDHVTMMLNAYLVGLSNVIVDLDSRLTPQLVADFKEQLLEYCYRTYSSEGEKDIFKQIFGSPPHITKAYRSGST